jgi:hypothetical protein
MKNKTITYLMVISSLVLGLIIYLAFREGLIINKLIDIKLFRNDFLGFSFPDWFIYSLPDGLWMFSLVLLIITYWDFNLNKSCIIWITISYLAGIMFEISQKTTLIKGTFDYIDLIFMTVASIFPILLTYKLKGVMT